MPELPEVEALSRRLDERLGGRTVDEVRLFSIAALKTHDPPVGDLRGRPIEGCSRRGKFLDLRTDGPHLVIHLARAGWLRWYDQLPTRRPAHRGRLAMQLRLDRGDGLEATEQGTEKRLAIHVVRRPEDVPRLAALGIDVLDPALDPATLKRLMDGSTSQLKGALSDQRLIAGIGNAYSDEILHAARLSPFRRASGLSETEVTALHSAMRAVVGAAVDRTASLDISELKPDKRAHMAVHGRTGQPCHACGDTVREVAFASRSLQYCPTCQTGGRVLADRRLSRLLR